MASWTPPATFLRQLNTLRINSINWSSDNLKFNQLIEAFEAHASLISLIRFSVNPGANSAIFLIESSDSSSIEGMISKIKDLDPQASVTLSSPNTNW